MEVYVLDSLFRRIQVVDKFEALIWTERFRRYGDFELYVLSNFENRTRFIEGTRLAMNESNRVMVVETVEDITDDDGRRVLKLTGRSLEKILIDRTARAVLSELNIEPKWIITGEPATIAREMFHTVCIEGALDPGDIIPGVIEGNVIFPEDTIGEPTDTITYEIDYKPLYDALTELCDIYDMGFRLVRDFNTNQLYWDVYMGSDRTSGQSTLPAVIFSLEMDNMRNTNELKSSASYKNVAYVVSKVANVKVYVQDIDPEISGWDRRVLTVKADDIADVGITEATARMIQRGKEELAKNRHVSAFDGEISQKNAYKYGRDYFLGDLVELRNTDGFATKMQVTEQIMVSDKEGERSYPTLSINTFITPGSWLAWDFNQQWQDLDTSPETWADQP